MVGYLAAGFALNAMGVEGGRVLEQIANLGVLLLLFGIGLKLRIKSLIRPEVWVGASIHMAITVLVFGAGIYGLGTVGLFAFYGMDFNTSLFVAFALSFSSTVFAVKVLEDKGEIRALHGRTAIGILIMQDIFAVIFLAASTGKLPSPWAVALLGLFFLRPVLMAIMDRCGHGELLVLFGLFMAFVIGAAGFELVGLKADLGALILGALVADHPRAKELAGSLLSFKDIFLVGFFLSIGLSGSPGIKAIGTVLLLVAALPFKVGLFFLLLTRFRLRARTSLMASFSLANYSEFGLFVVAVSAANGWIDSQWLVIIALALSVTFFLASLLNSAAHSLYASFENFLKRFETAMLHPDDEPLEIGDAKILIFGMGRIGTGAYDAMIERHRSIVIGIDSDVAIVDEHKRKGRNVVVGNASDSDFWQKLQPEKVQIVMLAMPHHDGNIFAARQLSAGSFNGLITATVRFPDEIELLKKEGVHTVYDFYTEAGTGFAEHVCRDLDCLLL